MRDVIHYCYWVFVTIIIHCAQYVQLGKNKPSQVSIEAAWKHSVVVFSTFVNKFTGRDKLRRSFVVTEKIRVVNYQQLVNACKPDIVLCFRNNSLRDFCVFSGWRAFNWSVKGNFDAILSLICNWTKYYEENISQSCLLTFERHEILLIQIMIFNWGIYLLLIVNLMSDS